MSKAKQETISEVAAAMRNEGHTGDASCLEWVSAKLTSYADRIEAAHKREDDQWRAALKPVLDISIDMNTSDLAMSMAIKEAKRIYAKQENFK